MIKQLDTNAYKDAWRKAERKSIISRFQTLGWDLESNTIPEGEEFKKSDFNKALKKAARPIEKPKPSPARSKT